MENREAIANIEYARKWLGSESDFSDEALDMAISALEKQEPMKPMAPELDPLGGVTHPCGNCGGELVSKFHDFCPWCGQAIKWEE